MAFLTICSFYAYTRHYRTDSGNAAGSPVDSAVLQQSTDPRALLGVADHFYWLNNGPAAGPLYEKSEKLFSERGDARNELYAKVGRLRSRLKRCRSSISHGFQTNNCKIPSCRLTKDCGFGASSRRATRISKLTIELRSEIGWKPRRLQMSWAKSNGQLGPPAN